MGVTTTWMLVFVYTASGTGMQVNTVRGIATEQACKAAAANFNNRWASDRAFCLPEGRQVSIEDLMEKLGGPEK